MFFLGLNGLFHTPIKRPSENEGFQTHRENSMFFLGFSASFHTPIKRPSENEGFQTHREN